MNLRRKLHIGALVILMLASFKWEIAVRLLGIYVVASLLWGFDK